MEVTPLVASVAVGTSLGVLGLVYSLQGSRRAPRSGSATHALGIAPKALARKLGLSLGAGLLALVLTRWPVAAFLTALLVAFLPAVIGRTATSAATERVEAIAIWTELLRDTLASSSGLGGAIMATAPVAPPAIREQAMRLADRLASGVNMTVAFRAFAAEVDDPSCDMVAAALLLAATARAQKLADLLGALSDSVREEVAMRLRVEASRASARSSVRTVVVFSLLFVGVLAVVARSYLAPLSTPVGQVVLAGVGACYAGGIALMVRMVRPTPRSRLLGSSSVVDRSLIRGQQQ